MNPRKGWISSKSLNFSRGLIIPHRCSKYFQCHSFIHVILPSWMLREWLCSVLTNTKLWWSYYPNSVIKIIHRSMVYENISLSIYPREVYISWWWYNTNSCNKDVHVYVHMVQHELLQWTTCALFPVDRYIFNDLISYLLFICYNLGTGHFSKIVPIIWNLNDLHKKIITKIENASKYFLH